MVWFFERNGAFIRCETRETADGAIELVISEPDGTEKVERFDDSTSLARRQRELESSLSDNGWMGPFGRTI